MAEVRFQILLKRFGLTTPECIFSENTFPTPGLGLSYTSTGINYPSISLERKYRPVTHNSINAGVQ